MDPLYRDISLTNNDLSINYRVGEEGGRELLRKEMKMVRALAGCQLGTSCPDPLTVMKLNPLYSSTYPPTCKPMCKK